MIMYNIQYFFNSQMCHVVHRASHRKCVYLCSLLFCI